MAKRKKTVKKKTTRKPRKLWLSRDYNSESFYDLWKKEPVKEDGTFYSAGKRIGAFCPSMVEYCTAYKLKPGACSQVTIHIKEC